MNLDSDFLLKVKTKVTDKLKTLGAFIDEELPDYIMVMVANKKSENSMTKDLQLFLGEHTVYFTHWLHKTLEELSSNEENEDHSKEHHKSKTSKKKGKSHKEDPVSGQQRHRSASSRSRSPIQRKSTQDHHVKNTAEAIVVQMDENEFNSEAISSTNKMDEARKVVTTASLSDASADSHIDSTESAMTLQSVVTERDAKPVRSKIERSGLTLQPPQRLLQKALNERGANIQAPKSAKSSVLTQPVPSSEVSSTQLISDETRFYVTMSEGSAQDNRRQMVRTTAADSSIGPHLHSDESRLVTSVKSRLGVRTMNSPPQRGRLSAKERLGPLMIQRQHHPYVVEQRQQDDVEMDDMVDEFDEDGDMVELVDDSEFNTSQLDAKQMRKVMVDRPMVTKLADRFNQKQLVVSLNEMDEDVVPLAPTQKSGHSALKANVVESEDGVNIPSHLERCKYWPHCRNPDTCQYIHPSEPCTTFPHCPLGATCIYIHPPCRYGDFCTRPKCAYAHSNKRAPPNTSTVPAVNPSRIVCRFQENCTNTICPYYHPPPTPVVPHYIPSYASTTSIPCRYGFACIKRSTCPYSHSAGLPNPNKLKWVAATKKGNSTSVQPTAEKSTAKSTV